MDPTTYILHLPLLQHPFLASLSQAFTKADFRNNDIFF